MRWTVMTIDAVHPSLVGCGNLLWFHRACPVVILSDIAVLIFNLHPRNYLPLLISWDVGNLIGNVHVPVNARHETGGRPPAADVYQHPRLSQRVLFVIGVMIERLHLRAEKLFGPMTLFAGFRR